MSAPKSNTDESKPAMLGGFRLVELLGRGGMGEVYRAERDGPGGYKRRAALKRILPRFQNDPTLRARFLAEARITARLDHPNIVQVLDFGDDPEPYLALEYVDGVTIARVLKHCADHNTRLPAVAAAYLVAEAATGLDYAHRRKGEQGEVLDIVHRDVSPQNILVSIEGAVKISDFGIARAADNQHRTAQGISVGKLAYMAPEQAQGAPIDRRADVFALGIVLWETLLVRPLIPRNDPTAAIAMLTRGGFDPPSRIDPKIPAVFDRIVLEALEIDPARRTSSAGQLAQSLRAFVHSVAPGFDGHELVRILAQLVPDVPWQNDGVVAPWNHRPNAPASPVVAALIGEPDAFAPPSAAASIAPAPIAARPPPQSAQPPTRVGPSVDQGPVPPPQVRGLPPSQYVAPGQPPGQPNGQPNGQPQRQAYTPTARPPGYSPPMRAPSYNNAPAWAPSAPQPAPEEPSRRGRNALLVLLTLGLILTVVVAMAFGVVMLLHRSGDAVPANSTPSQRPTPNSPPAPVRVPAVPSDAARVPAVPAVPAPPPLPPPLPPPPATVARPAVQLAPSYPELAEGAMHAVSNDVRRCIAQFPDAAERSVTVETDFDNATGAPRVVRVAFHVAHQGAPELRLCVEDVVRRRARFVAPAGATGSTHTSHSYRVAGSAPSGRRSSEPLNGSIFQGNPGRSF